MATETYYKKLVEQLRPWISDWTWNKARLMARGHAGGKTSPKPEPEEQVMEPVVLSADVLAQITDDELGGIHDSLVGEMERRRLCKFEPISKPYTADTLPDAVMALPKHGQEIWMAVFNDAVGRYPEEQQAFAAAWEAVGRDYEKVDGRWRLKKGLEVPIVKYDDFRGLIYGVVLSPYDAVPTEEDVDTQGDVISKREVEEACHRFMLAGHRLDLQHKRGVGEDEAAVVECYINPVTYEAEYAGGASVIKAGDWVLVVLLKSDELKGQAQEGEIGSFSIYGKGMRQSVELEVEKAVPTLLEVVNKASFTNASWDKSVTNRLSASDYCRCCLVDYNPSGEEKVKAKCKLPIRATPGGPIYRAALRNAASRLPQMKGVPAEIVAGAKRKLERWKSRAGVGED